MLTAGKALSFLWSYWKMNWQGAMEFRASFVTQVLSMLINNGVWIIFWGIYFTKFPVVNGWELRDIMILWGISAGGYGWAVALFGNSTRIAQLIATGQIDLYLTMPKNVLLHILISRMNFTGWGDYLFSWLMFLLAGGITMGSFFKYLGAQIFVGVLFLAVFILSQSLAFYFGHAEGLAQQVFIAMITFTTYPIDIFHGLTRVLLFVVLPAGLVSSLPITFFKYFSWGYTALTAVIILIFLGAAIKVFNKGLRRYESGNMITLRM